MVGLYCVYCVVHFIPRKEVVLNFNYLLQNVSIFFRTELNFLFFFIIRKQRAHRKCLCIQIHLGNPLNWHDLPACLFFYMSTLHTYTLLLAWLFSSFVLFFLPPASCILPTDPTGWGRRRRSFLKVWMTMK